MPDRFLAHHAPCLVEAFRTKRTVDVPRAFLFMGAPGSGKTRLKGFFVKARGATDFVYVDPDEYKARLPEYDGGSGASLVHEESSWIAQQVRASALGRTCNIMNDAVGSNRGKYAYLISRLEANGYTIELACIHWRDVEPLLDRVAHRANETGRVVPERIVRQAHREIPKVFNALKHVVDAAFLFDGKTGELAWERSRGDEQVHDPEFVATLD